jgi:CubicO group peptidase (beta-lactamase class C family)
MVKIASLLLALALPVPAPALAEATDEGRLAAVDDMAAGLMKAHGIPGIGIVGVRGGEVIYLRGFGTGDGTHPFKPTTRFYIASNTKGFTGLAMARLVEDGRISLDDAVSDYLPARFFANGADPARITIRDLLAHTTGLSNDPLVSRTAYSGELPRDLRTLLRFTEYRDESQAREFRYSNLGYLMSGMVIEQVTGMPWQAYVAQAVLQPAGMSRTTASVPARGEDAALPFDAGSPEPLAFRKTAATLHAAGGHYSTLEDMGRWLTLFTDPEQARLPTASVARATGTLVDGIDQSMGPFRIEGYGYGWAQGTLWDEPQQFHFGRFPGQDSMIAFSPADRLGVFVFVNERKGGIRVAGALSALYFAAMRGERDLAADRASLEQMAASAYAGS